MKKEEEVQFGFTVGDLATDSRGRTDCNICYRPFVVAEVEIMLSGFTVCPSCVLSGPRTVATATERASRNKARLEPWGDTPTDRQGIARCYREVSKELRRIESFEELPGGVMAVAIAGVATKDRARRRKAV